MDKKKYFPKQIEQKWQKIWTKTQPYKATIDLSKPKFYVLDMFPYPSGAGLHVGHVTGYTATDIFARFKRQMGFNVLHPMGWDSFGLPAEQYAIRTGTHPAITTQKNIETYRRQLTQLGFSYDWEREFSTSDPKYYKWTQWIFTKLYEKGLAYEAEMMVNFCKELGTVVANEEIEDGKTKEGGYPVQRLPLRQWILKITKYADRLIDDLQLVDWPEHIKKLQVNWIGKSTGANILFKEEKTGHVIEVYTTRPDTVFGISFVVLAPEHSLVNEIATKAEKGKVQAYQEKAAQKSDMQRTELNFEKTGVFTGAYAINPVTDEKIPIWISDYVLGHVGTGAVMGVPGSDERDFEFAHLFKIPIKAVVRPEEDTAELEDILNAKKCYPHPGIICHSKNKKLDLNGLFYLEAKAKVIQWLEANGLGSYQVNYKLRDWLFSRQRYWGEPIPILHFKDGSKRALDPDELPLTPPKLTDYLPTSDAKSPLAKVKDWIQIIDKKTKKEALRESNTMPQWAGSCWYYLRFADPTNEEQAWSKEAENYWLPVDLYVGGAEHATLHLLYARFWHKVLFDIGLVKTPEPFLKFRSVGLVVAPSYKKQNGVYVDPKDVITKDGNYFTNDSEELTVQIEKMSKSKLNGITPDEIIEEFGADALRLYETFMAPFDKEKLWNTDAILGCYRFLHRFYEMATSTKVKKEVTREALKIGYKLIDGALKDMQFMQFNTIIAKLMEFINGLIPLEIYPIEVVKWAIQVLYPFAPHISCELWEHLQINEDIHTSKWPEVISGYLEEDKVNYIIQINGKHRGTLLLPKAIDQNEVVKQVMNTNIAKRYITTEPCKIIFVPDKLVNFVIV